MRILIVTDAWSPQVNGVVRTLTMLGNELGLLGHEVHFVTPENHTTLPLPTYPEIRLAVYPRGTLIKAIDDFAPEAIHIATEGTMGLWARSLCLERGLPFTTSYHTRYPEYVSARLPFIPQSAVYGTLRAFHGAAAATMVATPSLMRELAGHGFTNLRLWSRGVDADAFRPRNADEPSAFPDLPRPIFLYVGRVAVEKNVEAFLALDLPGSKVVVGEGPARGDLMGHYADAHFTGPLSGGFLAHAYRSADVFVFPSRTDTFGLVLLEALASGVPVAAYPMTAPMDVIGDAPVAAIHHDLKTASLNALEISPAACREFALAHSWRAATEQFVANLAPIAATRAEEQRA
jgi:glycosyltransferase involved in cell wall biosynthesis